MQDRQKISIHALREEGDYRHHGRRSSGAISIHALREEGDLPVKPKRRGDVKFLSTPSARRATKLIPTYSPDIAISIHALREEGDVESLGTANADRLFLSTPSARRATEGLQELAQKVKFLSTPSARRATTAPGEQIVPLSISIHALREEGDVVLVSLWGTVAKFLSTPSARRATASPRAMAADVPYFYPRPPRGGRHQTGRSESCPLLISIHALREEGDHTV